VILNTTEATRKFKGSGTFVDLCNKCLNTIDEDVQYSEGNYEELNKEDEYD
jgi:hypothetical protein